MTGYVQVYTGDGKGKTTAALGLIVRAVGAGLRVYLGQFLKNDSTSEIRLLRGRCPEVTVEAFGAGRFVRGKVSAREKARGELGLDHIRNAMTSGKYDIVICDEINVAAHFGAIAVADILRLIDIKPDNVELVLTGRRAEKRVIARSDLVVEMKNVKHYFSTGAKARRGIEK